MTYAQVADIESLKIMNRITTTNTVPSESQKSLHFAVPNNMRYGECLPIAVGAARAVGIVILTTTCWDTLRGSTFCIPNG